MENGHKINIKTCLDLGKEGGLHVSFLFFILSVALDNSPVPIFKVESGCILENKLSQLLASSSTIIIKFPWMRDVV